MAEELGIPQEEPEHPPEPELTEDDYKNAQLLLAKTGHQIGEQLDEGLLKETLRTSRRLKEFRQKYDSNSDGALTDEELEPLIAASKHIAEVQTLIKKYDTDNDGVLNEAEQQALVEAYEQREPDTLVLQRWDKNQDGTLDPEELQSLLEDTYNPTDAFRYTAYTFTLQTILFQSVRYTAYTSDLGESFRPIISPRLVTASYAASWSYVIGDVLWAGSKALKVNKPRQEVAEIVGERLLFQSVASMLIPAFTIHSVVRLAKYAFMNVKNQALHRWAPTALGLAVIPFLPVLIDPPVENALHWAKTKLYAYLGRPPPVRPLGHGHH